MTFRALLEATLDKIFVDEAVNELHTIQDMLRWSVSRFNAAEVYYGHGTDNPGMRRCNWCYRPSTCRWISPKRCAMRA